MKLFDYFRSSASYRVRLALAYKSIKHELTEIHLVNNGGEQHSESYQAINPQGLVPTLETPEGVITQSLSILEYLEETHPQPPLLPTQPIERAYVRQLCYLISCDIHPLNNLRVLKYLKEQFKISEDQTNEWYHHWIHKGFESFEAHLKMKGLAGKFCYGDQVTLADLCLIPQVYNANRFGCSIEHYPLISKINENILQIETLNKVAP